MSYVCYTVSVCFCPESCEVYDQNGMARKLCKFVAALAYNENFFLPTRRSTVSNFFNLKIECGRQIFEASFDKSQSACRERESLTKKKLCERTVTVL